MGDAEDWRLAAGEELRGASFVRLAWTPPPPEWVAVERDADGRVAWLRLRREPGPPGWGPGERPLWDHDHCEACSAKFAQFEGPQIEHEGYTTCSDYKHGAGYAWVCKVCFEDLKDEMHWTLISDDERPSDPTSSTAC